ncbi:hypothetical protein FACS1894109_05390 [Spirochaetia bacterium]|nr:hypothetical protein FACS1894109_05390 [Spirochaetia bacterium]
MRTYVAHIWQDTNGTYSVEFPDLPGCYTWGETLEEAQAMAKEALTGYLEGLATQHESAPHQTYYPVPVTT